MNTTTRRALLGTLAIAPLAAAVPANAAFTPAGSADFAIKMREAEAATDRFNNLPDWLEDRDSNAYAAEEQLFFAASRIADQATPTTWAEFVRLFEHVTDNGISSPTERSVDHLLHCARRLLSRGEA